MEELREELYGLIDRYGIDYEKLIFIDKRLHQKVISVMREDLKKEEDKVLKGALVRLVLILINLFFRSD